MIDDDTRETCWTCLRNRLLQPKHANRDIDLLVVTHIDNDHIDGIIKLLKENGSEQESRIVKIFGITATDTYTLIRRGRQKNRFLEILLRGDGPESGSAEKRDKEISVLQGTALAALILQGGYSWNLQFDGKAMSSWSEEILFGSFCL